MDALQTKIAVNVQNLDQSRYKEQLSDNIAELPDATGCDAAFLVLFSNDFSSIDTVLASSNVFSSCNAEPLTGEQLSNWPWLCQRLGHLKIIEINDTSAGPTEAREEFSRFAELGIGSALIIGFSVRNDVAGFLALANEHPTKQPSADLHLPVSYTHLTLPTTPY